MRKLMGSLCATVLLVGAPVMAQERDWMPSSADVFAGAGVGNFSQDLGDVTSAGIGWSARAGAQLHPMFGGEIAYQGLNGGVNTLVGGANNPVIANENINQHLFSANARVGMPIEVRGTTLRPYGLVGVGYSRLNSTDALATVGLPSDNQFAVPLGVGASYALTNNLLLDGRFTYNVLSGVDIPLANDDADSWTALVNLGASFGL